MPPRKPGMAKRSMLSTNFTAGYSSANGRPSCLHSATQRWRQRYSGNWVRNRRCITFSRQTNSSSYWHRQGSSENSNIQEETTFTVRLGAKLRQGLWVRGVPYRGLRFRRQRAVMPPAVKPCSVQKIPVCNAYVIEHTYLFEVGH